MSKTLKSDFLDPWKISETNFPKRGSPSEQLEFLLNYAVLAPSGYNSQPWLFKIVHETIELYADRTRAVPVIDPYDRELTISCGAALYNLRIAIRHFGWADAVKIFPNPDDPDLIAHVWLGNPRKETEEEYLLFATITRRRTNRLPFQHREIPEALLSIMEQSVAQEDAWFHILSEEDDRNAVADLIAEGDRIQMTNPHFRRELAAWIHNTRKITHDGMPAYAADVSQLLNVSNPIIADHTSRTFDTGTGKAAQNRELAIGAPVLAVLGTQFDTFASWLSAGQALERVLLLGQAVGVSASFLNQPIQVAELRSQLQTIIKTPGYPQILLRLGFGTEINPTPRRSVTELLVYE
ncbi:MAG: nitroreductase [Scytonema sp. PMC 1069.18]|nr:nitroreductase [Scytonema sp. PMC 1069.18]MEC4882197.1 nitroreductase [Scytonema sp. PMC 1070.18]